MSTLGQTKSSLFLDSVLLTIINFDKSFSFVLFFSSFYCNITGAVSQRQTNKQSKKQIKNKTNEKQQREFEMIKYVLRWSQTDAIFD